MQTVYAGTHLIQEIIRTVKELRNGIDGVRSRGRRIRERLIIRGPVLQEEMAKCCVGLLQEIDVSRAGVPKHGQLPEKKMIMNNLIFHRRICILMQSYILF